jgi:integrase
MAEKKKLADKVDKRRRKKIVVGHDANGKPIKKYSSGRSDRAAADNRDEIKKKYVGGKTVKRDVIFEVYLRQWYKNCKEPHIGDSSKRNYNSIINKHIIPAFENRQLRSIEPMELRAFINRFAGKGQTTITYIHAVLTGMFGLATEDGILDKDPALRLKKPEHSFNPRRDLTEKETEAALYVGNTHPYGLLLLLLYYLGVRKGEALGLMASDINFEDHIISIQRDIDYVTNDIGEVKTDESVRDLPIPDGLFKALLPYRDKGNKYLLSADGGTSFWCASTYNRYWEKLMAAMYDAAPSIENELIDEDEELRGSVLTAHYFRHNFATLLYDAEVDVLTAQKYLGHSDVKTTLGIYTKLKKRREKQSAAKLRTAFDLVAELKAVESKVAKRLPVEDKIIDFAEMRKRKTP